MLPITIHIHLNGYLLLASLLLKGEPSSSVSVKEKGTAEKQSFEWNKKVLLLYLLPKCKCPAPAPKPNALGEEAGAGHVLCRLLSE